MRGVKTKNNNDYGFKILNWARLTIFAVGLRTRARCNKLYQPTSSTGRGDKTNGVVARARARVALDARRRRRLINRPVSEGHNRLALTPRRERGHRRPARPSRSLAEFFFSLYIINNNTCRPSGSGGAFVARDRDSPARTFLSVGLVTRRAHVPPAPRARYAIGRCGRSPRIPAVVGVICRSDGGGDTRNGDDLT